MTPMGLLSIFAYCLFLAGAGKSFRDNGSRAAVRIMLAGILLDMVLSFLPMLGLRLGDGITVFIGVIQAAIAAGSLVWVSFFVALYFRRKRRMALYHGLILTSEIGWFVSFICFIYGMYKFS